MTFDIKKFLVENNVTTISRIDEKIHFSGDASTMKGLRNKLTGDKVSTVKVVISPQPGPGSMSLSLGGITATLTPQQAIKLLDFMGKL